MIESWDDMMMRVCHCLEPDIETVRNILRLEKRYTEQVEEANKWAEKLGRPGRITREQWDAVREHYGPYGWCMKCNKWAKNGLELNHIISLSRGGSNILKNIQPLCWDCSIDQLIDPIRPADYRPDKGEFAKSLEQSDCDAPMKKGAR